MLPKDIAKLVPKTHLMSESEWRNLGVHQSQGWVHYMIHEPGQWDVGRLQSRVVEGTGHQSLMGLPTLNMQRDQSD